MLKIIITKMMIRQYQLSFIRHPIYARHVCKEQIFSFPNDLRRE